MSALHMVELTFSRRALLAFLEENGLMEGPRGGDEDLGYGMHAWLMAAFGSLAPRPWRLFERGNAPLRVLAYGSCDAVALRERMRDFASPSALAVCPPGRVRSKPMPGWIPGRRLGFEVLCCPVGRKAANGTEKDLFLLRADEAGHASLDRGRIYGDWVTERMERGGACRIHDVELAGFRLVRQLRRTQGKARKPARPLRPWALLRGTLEVGDPTAFATLLSHGVGRHRAFGYGMVLLRPPD
ncbi:MAG TPA: type I-E CRISPR-associated protein Cas6/Cse3/CasE [Chromatiales bacterium]|nr:type I-E CRISPR-associated protein Cas6/Cse3/CasE [Chromatiales bacterium]